MYLLWSSVQHSLLCGISLTRLVYSAAVHLLCFSLSDIVPICIKAVTCCDHVCKACETLLALSYFFNPMWVFWCVHLLCFSLTDILPDYFDIIRCESIIRIKRVNLYNTSTPLLVWNIYRINIELNLWWTYVSE